MRMHHLIAAASLVLIAACGKSAAGGVSASDLAAAFEADPAGAIKKYGAGPVTVTGEVASVNGTDVALKTKSMMHKVHATVPAGAVKDGKTVTLTCSTLTAQGRDAMLSGCTAH